MLFGYEIIFNQVYRNTERETPVQGAHPPPPMLFFSLFSVFIVFQRKKTFTGRG